MANGSGTAIVMELLESGFGRGDRAVFDRLVAPGYIQHNPLLPTGRAGLYAMLEAVRRIPDNRFVPLRLFEDGDFVVLHSEWRSAGETRAVFDLFRVENGLLAEHWDAMQRQPERTASGRTMLDGPTAIGDPADTEANKRLVADFTRAVLIEGRDDRWPAFFDGGRCLQHDPRVRDGAAAFVAGAARLTRLHRVLGAGAFVLTQGEAPRTAVYSLYRVEGEKIAEHWNAIQAIPDEMAHDNGAF